MDEEDGAILSLWRRWVQGLFQKRPTKAVYWLAEGALSEMLLRVSQPYTRKYLRGVGV